jgi:hypothetical protein
MKWRDPNSFKPIFVLKRRKEKKNYQIKASIYIILNKWGMQNEKKKKKMKEDSV